MRVIIAGSGGGFHCDAQPSLPASPALRYADPRSGAIICPHIQTFVNTMMHTTRTTEVLQLAIQHGVVSTRELKARGIASCYPKRLCDRGLLTRSSRGVYVPSDSSAITEHHSLVEICVRSPRAVVCLLSALRFHGITTQNPFEVWIALPRNARTPKLEWPPLRVFHFSGKTCAEGIEEHTIEGVNVRVYSVARTVVDCFKFRHQIGLDAALEALRDTWRHKRTCMDEIWHYAKICRMTHVMLPYLEAITG